MRAFLPLLFLGTLSCSASQPTSDKKEIDASLSDSSGGDVDSDYVSRDASELTDSTPDDIGDGESLDCEGPTLQELGLTRTTSVYVVMQIIRVDTDKRLFYPIIITPLGSPMGIESETTQDNVTVTLDGDLIVNILPDDRLAMTGQFVWKGEGQDEVVTPMASCISGFGPLPDVSFMLSNGVEIVIHTQFLQKLPE